MAIADDFLDLELKFTETHRQHQRDPIPLREAYCLGAQFPAILTGIQDNDLIAGRIKYGLVGFRVWERDIGYYCQTELIRRECEHRSLSPGRKRAIEKMLTYWNQQMAQRLERLQPGRQLPLETNRVIPDSTMINKSKPEWMVGEYTHRIAGLNINFDKLLRSGIPGLKSEINRHREGLNGNDRKTCILEAMVMMLDLLRDLCLFYASQARAKLKECSRPERHTDLSLMADALDHIASQAPASFQEALQLFWLYSLFANIADFGRMDVYFGDFYARDIENNRISEERALRLLLSLWALIGDTCNTHAARVFVGGVGRRNPQNADRFALLAIEATHCHRGLIPQLSLRCYSGMDERIWNRALDVIEGTTFPMLYNDDVMVKAIAREFNVPFNEAEQYIVSDCGEHGLQNRSIGTPNATINLAAVLELALRNGRLTGNNGRVGLETGDFTKFSTFDDVWLAFIHQVEYFVEFLADAIAPFYNAIGAEAACLAISLLYDNCLERGLGLFAGGARYRGYLIETYGNITCSDSLMAISHLVFEQGKFTPVQLLRMLDANWDGFEKERLQFLAAPKYGNDDPSADEMAVRFHQQLTTICQKQAQRLSLDFCLADIINAGGWVSLGRMTGATPDGRFAGEPLTNANSPAAGRDRQGVTAMLKSLAKLDVSLVGGQVQNLKFNKDLFKSHREKLSALLRAYFLLGGPQAMITVVGRQDLENAMKNPEKYGNLLVRVGGFTARFVSLPKELQSALIARNLH